MIPETSRLAEINGKKSFAHTGQRPWGNLGQQLTPKASIETWATEAGLDFELLDAPVKFSRPKKLGLPTTATFNGQRVIYRSDTGDALSVVSDRYKKVQPIEILDFFREFTEAGDMTLETAGCLDNGAKVWALARIDDDFMIDGKAGKDRMRTYALLASSCDKSISSVGHLTLIRDLCTNTLRASYFGKKAGTIKIPHSRVFNPEEIKKGMGLVKGVIKKNAQVMQKMHKLTVTDKQAMNFFLELLKTPKEQKTGDIDIDSKRRAIPKIWTSYKSAPGAENTVWGMVNAVTHSVDYNPHARSDNARLNRAWFGAGAQQKEKAYAMACDENFLDSIVEHTQSTQSALDRVLSVVDY